VTRTPDHRSFRHEIAATDHRRCPDFFLSRNYVQSIARTFFTATQAQYFFLKSGYTYCLVGKFLIDLWKSHRSLQWGPDPCNGMGLLPGRLRHYTERRAVPSEKYTVSKNWTGWLFFATTGWILIWPQPLLFLQSEVIWHKLIENSSITS